MKNGTAPTSRSANQRDNEYVVMTRSEFRQHQMAAFRRGLLASVQSPNEPAPLAATG